MELMWKASRNESGIANIKFRTVNKEIGKEVFEIDIEVEN